MSHYVEMAAIQISLPIRKIVELRLPYYIISTFG